MNQTISAIVIARDEAAMIANCLETLKWCDEVIVVDHESSDGTAEIAERGGARVTPGHGSFAELRNLGLQRAKTEWVLYVDADERVTPQLAQEIQRTIVDATHAAFIINRQNILYGHLLQHGGWGEDWIVRLFRRESLETWVGDVHEHAEIKGTTGRLTSPLVHLTHRDVISGLIKSAHWTPIEAQALFEAGVPKVGAKTLLRKTFMELWRRVVTKRGYKDGTAGWVEALIQAMNRLIVYIQVWELQQRPSLPERYQKYEESIVKLWQAHHED